MTLYQLIFLDVVKQLLKISANQMKSTLFGYLPNLIRCYIIYKPNFMIHKPNLLKIQKSQIIYSQTLSYQQMYIFRRIGGNF